MPGAHKSITFQLFLKCDWLLLKKIDLRSDALSRRAVANHRAISPRKVLHSHPFLKEIKLLQSENIISIKIILYPRLDTIATFIFQSGIIREM